MRGGSFWTVACALAMPVLAVAQAKLAIQGPVWDFGEVEQGVSVDHTFHLMNQGSEPLLVDQVKTTCGCTAAVTSATEIPPGQAATVAVTLDTTKLAGRTTKTLTVYTNDPNVPAAGLTLTGSVLTDVVATPSVLYVGRLRRGAAGRFEIAVTPGRPNAPIAIVEVKPDNALLSARVDAADGGGQKIVVETSPEIPTGKFNAEVTITTTSTRTPKIVVPVFGTVEAGSAVSGVPGRRG